MSGELDSTTESKNFAAALVLPKPFRLEQLLAAVGELILQHRSPGGPADAAG
jgi:DNA-binding response OmpR family regulator